MSDALDKAVCVELVAVLEAPLLDDDGRRLEVVSGHPREQVVGRLVLEPTEVEPEEGVDEDLQRGERRHVSSWRKAGDSSDQDSDSRPC